MSNKMQLDESFRCFWEMIELERDLERPKKYKPIQIQKNPNDILCEFLSKIEWGVKIYEGEAICPNGHIKRERDYFKMDDKYCTQCGAKLYCDQQGTLGTLPTHDLAHCT